MDAICVSDEGWGFGRDRGLEVQCFSLRILWKFQQCFARCVLTHRTMIRYCHGRVVRIDVRSSGMLKMGVVLAIFGGCLFAGEMLGLTAAFAGLGKKTEKPGEARSMEQVEF